MGIDVKVTVRLNSEITEKCNELAIQLLNSPPL